MQLDKIQTKIRARNHWEAIDLGFVFARQWFWQLWISWVMLALPFFMLFHFIFFDNIWLASIFLWWFKPLFEQPLLFILSRRLFDDKVDSSYIRRHIFSIIKPQLLANLSWRRLSVNRSFNNPVAMLEKLRGKQRSKRLALLHRQQKVSSWLTIIGVHIEGILNLSIIAFVSQLIPSSTDWLEFTDFFDQASQHYQLAAWIGNIAYFISLSIFAPFYVAAGFSLYLYSRVKLEGWEIEITFKQLQNRLEKLKSVIPILLLTCLITIGNFFPVEQLHAETTTNIDESERVPLNAQQAKQSIEEILQREDFGTKFTATKWRVKSNSDKKEIKEVPEWLENFLNWLFKSNNQTSIKDFLNLASIIEILLWLAGATLLIFLWKKFSPGFSWNKLALFKKLQSEKSSSGITLLSQQLELDKLPDDIISQVRQYCDNHEYRLAVGLLYRAALHSLIEKEGMQIPYSATEADCTKIVDSTRPAQESSYFKVLTHHWLVVAYGHSNPLADDVLALLSEWQRFYGQVNNA